MQVPIAYLHANSSSSKSISPPKQNIGYIIVFHLTVILVRFIGLSIVLIIHLIDHL